MSHRTRIAALERRLAPADTTPMLIRVNGGLPGAAPVLAAVDSRELELEVNETLRAFEVRALACGKAAGQQFVVVTTLPN